MASIEEIQARQQGAGARAAALQERQDRVEPRASIFPESVRTFAGAALEGIPIAGPAILEGAQHVRSLVQGQPVEQVREETEEMFEERPGTTTAGNVTGAVIGLAPLAVGGPGAALFGTAGRAMASGAAIGGADTAARGGGAEDIAMGTALGGAFGAAGPAVGRFAGRVAGGIGARIRGVKKAPRPELQQLRKNAGQLYTAADEAGVTLTQGRFGGMVDDLATAAQDAGINAQLHPKAAGFVQFLTSQKGRRPSLREVDQIRQMAGDIAGSADRGEARIGTIMIRQLDDALENLTEAGVSAGNPQAGLQALTSARELWRRGRVLEELDRAFELAEITNSPLGQAVQVQVRRLLRNQKFTRGLTKAEKAALTKVVKSPADAALGMLGGFRSMIGSVGGGSAGFLLGGPAGAAAAAAGTSLASIGARGLRSQLAVARFEAARASASGLPGAVPPTSQGTAAAARTGTVASGIILPEE